MKIVGIMTVGKGESSRYLKASLDELKRLCDEAVIAMNDTDPETEAMIKSYGFWYYRDDREWGIYQPSIKTDLLKNAGRFSPDWIIAIDSDEVFDSSFTREKAEELAAKPGIGYYFYVVNLWNSEERYFPQWSFWNVRYYKYAPEHGLEFQKKNLHCGLAPPLVYHYGNYAPFVLKHYGLMKKEDREKKVARYEQYDPGAKFKDRSYYEMLKSKYEGADFSEAVLHEKVVNEVKNYKQKDVKPMATKGDFIYARRLKDGKVLDMRRGEWEAIRADFQRRKEWEFVSDVNIAAATASAPPPPIIKDPLQCDACDYVGGSTAGLRMHRMSRHGIGKKTNVQ